MQSNTSDILITGFEPFASIKQNPSQLVLTPLMEKLSGLSIGVEHAVLPVVFAKAGALLRSMDYSQYRLVVHIGVSEGSSRVELERVALNLMDTTLPDNDSTTAVEESIAADAPPAYISPLPLRHIAEELTEKGFAITTSNHAGTYLCNYVYFLSKFRSQTEGTGTEVIFIHVPLILPEQAEEFDKMAECLAHAIQSIYRHCQRQNIAAL